MRRTLVLILLGAVFVLPACSDDPAAPQAPEALAQVDFRLRGGINVVGDSILLEFSPRDAVETDILRVRVGEGDQGSVIQIDESTLTSFTQAAEVLTNGNDDVWTLDYEILPPGGGGARHNTEANWLLGGLTGEYRPDLAGTTITHVLVIVDDATVDTPGDDPNGDGMWTDYDLDVRMVVFGQP